jgi:hypothetical protein
LILSTEKKIETERKTRRKEGKKERGRDGRKREREKEKEGWRNEERKKMLYETELVKIPQKAP